MVTHNPLFLKTIYIFDSDLVWRRKLKIIKDRFVCVGNDKPLMLIY